MPNDLSHAPCELHAVPIGECGCPAVMIDQDWLDAESRQAMFAAGVRARREDDQALIEAFGDPGDTVLE